MLYNLYAPMWDTNDTLRKLLKEVLGYQDHEIAIMESEWFDRNIVNNLTVEQAKEISEIFCDNDFVIYLNPGTAAEDVIAWRELGMYLQKHSPKQHYCDEPLVSREHLADLSISNQEYIRPIVFENEPVVECPYCHSTNVRKIGGGERALSVFGLGLFSNKINKSFQCKNCGGTF